MASRADFVILTNFVFHSQKIGQPWIAFVTVSKNIKTIVNIVVDSLDLMNKVNALTVVEAAQRCHKIIKTSLYD